MKKSLLASTAITSVACVTGGAAYADAGSYVTGFGGVNILDDLPSAITTLSNEVLFSSFFSALGPGTYVSGASGFDTFLSGEVTSDTDLGFVFGGAFGHDFGNNFRIEVEGAWRRNKFDLMGTMSGAAAFFSRLRFVSTGTSIYTRASSTKAISGTATGDGKIQAVSIMANAWYEFELGNSAFKPYVGGGVGWAHLRAEGALIRQVTGVAPPYSGLTGLITSTFGIGGPSTTRFDEHASGFAWQLGAGLDYQVSEQVSIGVQYRYFNGGEIKDLDYDYEAHNVLGGVKFGF